MNAEERLAVLRQRESDLAVVDSLLFRASRLHAARNDEMEAVNGSSKVSRQLDLMGCQLRAEAARILADLETRDADES